MDTRQKLIILADAAKYDASCASHQAPKGRPLGRVRRREQHAAGARQSDLFS